MDIKLKLKTKKDYIDANLNEILPKETTYPEVIYKAMRYSVFAGGKRIRPIILTETCKLFNNNLDNAVIFACALELIHTYSLIHDDLPAMDNDNFRRGRLTSHRAFGENIAILAGDALLSYAFHIMTDVSCKTEDVKYIKATKAISDGAGIDGMIVGQVVDVISEGKKIDKHLLDFIHLNKTAKMIKAAFLAGAIIGGANEDSLYLLGEAGEKIGIAFQIQDDILDITGDEKELGKPIFSDEKNLKTTYVTLFGVDESKKYVEKLSNEAIEILERFGERSEFLIELTKFLIYRNV